MNTSLRRFLCLAWCVAAMWPTAMNAEPASPPSSPAVLPPEAVADFEWFGTLGFPDVHGCPAVRVATGLWSQSGSHAPENRFVQGFLLRHDDSTGRFRVLTSDLFTRDFETTKPGTPEHQRVHCEEEVLATVADTFLANLARPRDEDDGGLRRRFGERLSERAELFAWAWGCWRNELDDRAARLYEHAAGMTSRLDQSREGVKPPDTLRGKLERDLGYAMIWRATLNFEDLKIPRTQLLESFERVARDYPGSEYAASARDTADRLRVMVEEDAAHTVVPIDDLPPDARIAELIFRLRDQNGHQFSQPGSCDIFDDFGGMAISKDEAKSPAHQLVALGYAAVPQLIAALDGRAFSRSVGFHRDFYFSHHVLTVGDCAQQILQRIAGRSFYTAKTTSSYMSRDGETPGVKEEAETWWKEFQQKGEKGVLIDAVVEGDPNAAQQAELLCKHYPDAALEPLIEGARKSTDLRTRERLVTLIGQRPGDAPVTFLEEELRAGPVLGTRIAAARALWQHGLAEEAGTAMIDEWDHPRPPYRAGKPLKMGQATTDAVMAAEIAFQNARSWEEQGRGELIGFLAGCGRADAIEALGRGLRARSVGTRLNVLSAMASDRVNQGIVASGDGGTGNVSADRDLRRQSADDEAKVAAAVEALLVAELDDPDQRLGMSGTRNGKDFSDPYLGDFAGEILAERFKDKYTFDLGASVKERVRQRIVCANLWRGEHGQPLLPLPAAHRVDSAPDETILPLLRTLVAPDEAEAHVAAVALTRLGLSALAPLRAFKSSLRTDDPARIRLETLERSLANTVVETVVDSLPSSSVEHGLMAQARLDKLKGQPLTAAAFVELTIDAAGPLWMGVGGFALSATRDEDLDGVRVVLKFLPVRKDDEEDASSNDMNEHVRLGGDNLYSVFGGVSMEARREAGEYKKFAQAAERALSAAADQPFSLLISLRGH